MFLRLGVIAMNYWADAKGGVQRALSEDRGDSPVPTVIIWAGVGVIAVALIGWVYSLVSGYESKGPVVANFSPTASP